MSEETQDHNDGTWTGLKKTIVGVITTAVTAGGVWISTLLGGGDKEAAPVAAPAPVINITNSNQQAQQAGGGTKVIERVVEKPAAQPAPKPKKKEGDEFKEEAPKW